MAQYVVDRFEGRDWTVLENPLGKPFSIPREWLPESVREGDVIAIEFQSAEATNVVTFQLDGDARKQLEAQIIERRASLPKGPKGGFSL